MEEFEDELEVKDEWLVTEPTPSTKTTVIVCPTCGAAHPRRNHMPKGKFDPECPRCRRKRTMREMQRRRYAKMKAEKATTVDGVNKMRAKVWRRTVGRLDFKIRDHREALERYAAVRAEKGRLGVLQARREHRHQQLLAFYESVRPTMLTDWQQWEEKPFLFYMEKEPIL